MNLHQLPVTELRRAHEAADYLLGLQVRPDSELVIKLSMFRADLTVEIEDRDSADPAARRAAMAQASTRGAVK